MQPSTNQAELRHAIDAKEVNAPVTLAEQPWVGSLELVLARTLLKRRGHDCVLLDNAGKVPQN